MSHQSIPGLRRRQLLRSSSWWWLAMATTPLHAQTASALSLSGAINRAGKMRAMSQRCSKAYVQITLNVLPDKAKDILVATRGIIRSHLDELTAAKPTGEVRQLLLALQQDARTLLDLVAEPPNTQAVPEVVRAADVMLESADKLTRAYQGLSQQASAKIVNVAGRQRMLSQRAARAYFLLAAGQDSAAVRKQLELAQTEFKQGLQTLQDAPVSTPLIRNELDLAKNQWLFYENALQKKPSPDSLKTVATTSERVFEVMDNLTSLYDAAMRDLLG